MNKDPSKRPTAVEILQDSYVHSHLEVCLCVCPMGMSMCVILMFACVPSVLKEYKLRILQVVSEHFSK